MPGVAEKPVVPAKSFALLSNTNICCFLGLAAEVPSPVPAKIRWESGEMHTPDNADVRAGGTIMVESS